MLGLFLLASVHAVAATGSTVTLWPQYGGNNQKCWDVRTAAPLVADQAECQQMAGSRAFYTYRNDDGGTRCSVSDTCPVDTIVKNTGGNWKIFANPNPATSAPTTAPTTDAPTTDAPTTDAPTTDAPTTNAPTAPTDAPTSSTRARCPSGSRKVKRSKKKGKNWWNCKCSKKRQCRHTDTATRCYAFSTLCEDCVCLKKKDIVSATATFTAAQKRRLLNADCSDAFQQSVVSALLAVNPRPDGATITSCDAGTDIILGFNVTFEDDSEANAFADEVQSAPEMIFTPEFQSNNSIEEVSTSDVVAVVEEEEPPGTECAPSCLASWGGDGQCDLECNNTACNFDGGDCAGPRCAENCFESYISDGTCDISCNNTECNFDGGDCDGSTECAPDCLDTWASDGQCDISCNNTACNFDGGDCDDDSYGYGYGYGDTTQGPSVVSSAHAIQALSAFVATIFVTTIFVIF